jgi:hypothetical protein
MITFTDPTTACIWELSISATNDGGRQSSITRRFDHEPSPEELADATAELQTHLTTELTPPPKPPMDPELLAAVLANIQP